jgi:hypothetical protein
MSWYHLFETGHRQECDPDCEPDNDIHYITLRHLVMGNEDIDVPVAWVQWEPDEERPNLHAGRPWEANPDAPCKCDHGAGWPLRSQRCAMSCDCPEWQAAPYPHPDLGFHETSTLG